MANRATIRATVTGANDGYTVMVVLEKGGQSVTLAEKSVDSGVEAEAVARALAAHHGIPRHEVDLLYRCRAPSTGGHPARHCFAIEGASAFFLSPGSQARLCLGRHTSCHTISVFWFSPKG